MRAVTGIICQECRKPTPKRGNGPQKYCPVCSTARDLKRKAKWARCNPPPHERTARYGRQSRSRAIERGKKISAEKVKHSSLISGPWRPIDLQWIVRTWVPFSYAASKNHTWTIARQGHIMLREEHRRAREALAWKIRAALGNRRIAINKVWLDIFVEKPNHKGDAVNVIDFVCDAAKVAIGLDDRWFALRRLDWAISKNEPRLYVGIGQESDEDMQVCSHCGRVLSLDQFWKNRYAKLGVGRACRECTGAPDRRNHDKGKPAVGQMVEMAAKFYGDKPGVHVSGNEE